MVRVDLRTIVLDIPPQDLITRDNVTAKVNAVTYFRVVDANSAVVKVEQYLAATSQIAQTTLRSVLGKADLDMLLGERERLNEALQQIIDEQTDPWGVKVTAVEIKDVEIPGGMQRAMARQAEAERERRAKVIHAEGEFQASQRLRDAAEVISRQPRRAAVALPADAHRGRRQPELDDRLPAPARRDPPVPGALRRQARRRRAFSAARGGISKTGARHGCEKEGRHGTRPLRAVRRSRRRVSARLSARRDPAHRTLPRGASRRPTPRAIDFSGGELLGCVSGGLGLRRFLEDAGHRLTVTSDKDGPDSVFERELPDADVVISQPFWPAYLTPERIAKAPKLKLAMTAGIGSDHVDLDAAIEHGVTVAEVTYSNSISVSEHVVMMILTLVRNYLPSHGGCSTAAGTSPTASRAPMTWRACRSARSAPGGSARPCCGG